MAQQAAIAQDLLDFMDALELDRVESLNDDPAFIEILAGLARAKPAYPPKVPTP